MNYFHDEWKHYNDQGGAKRLVLALLSIVEDVLRRLHLPWRTFAPIWFLRTRLTEGKTRRLLRPVIKYWAQHGISETDYFDYGDRALSVTFEWVDIRVMKGYNRNDSP